MPLIITRSMMPFLFILAWIHSSNSAPIITQEPVSEPQRVEGIPVHPGFAESNRSSKSFRRKKLELGSVLIAGNSTISSENRTFELGFFSANGGLDWYLGIWYASIPTPTYVWVANREIPLKNQSSARAEIAADGRFQVVDAKDSNSSVVWQSGNSKRGKKLELMDSGNLVLVSDEGSIVWQSFDFPADTFLPGMNITANQSITCWRSPLDPSPGNYSLRLKPPSYGEFELVYNHSEAYWSTGNWNGATFAGIPEMTVEYIYKFRFTHPFTPGASFGYTEVAPPAESGLLRPPLTRLYVDPSGRLRQFTWSSQSQSWNIFWSQPENQCRVYGLCGDLGFCNRSRCACLDGLSPVDGSRWGFGDYSAGCRRDDGGGGCDSRDEFNEIGAVSFDGAAIVVSLSGSKGVCEKSCLSNCSCIGFFHNPRTSFCRNLYGSLLNIRNLAPGDTQEADGLYLRVQRRRTSKKINRRVIALISSITGFAVILGFLVAAFLIFRRRFRERRKEEEQSVFSVTNLKVFSHKELQGATRDFSEKLGHGGFGAVFRGELCDSSPVAVKRLERPRGGEREFRAEVGTIGNIQHVNLVRLRGFCSEDSHRLLVYDYMPNGSLSSYLRRRRDAVSLSWDVRFRVAVGTAKGIAYLHEECRDRIIHCDIKPENILLDADFTAKVSDFGLAKLVGRDFSRVLATMRGTWGYVAPEWISGVAITTKADVYSYGMTLLELIGGRRNVEPTPTASSPDGERPAAAAGDARADGWFFPPWAARQIIEGNVAAVVDERLGGEYSAAEAERVGMVAVWCIQDEEGSRPTMGTVVKMLEGVLAVGVPPPPKLLQALVSGESFRGVRADSSDGASTAGGGGPVDSAQISGGSHFPMGNNNNTGVNSV